MKKRKTLYKKILMLVSVLATVWTTILGAEEESTGTNVEQAENEVVWKNVVVWKSEAELGLVKTSGNTDTSSINTRIDITSEREKWRHNVHLEGYSSESDNVSSAERYQFSEKSDYKFNQFDYLFVRTDYDDDRFSGLDYQASFSAGYGHRFLNRGSMSFDVEAGPGIRYSKAETMSTEKEGFLRMAAKYVWDISENSRFTQELTSDRSSDLAVSKSVTMVQANLNSSLVMKLTHTIRHKSDVPIGKKRIDRETATTLVYLF